MLLGVSSPVFATPTIDTAWGNAGRLTFNLIGGVQSSGKQVLPVANGKLLVLGFCTSQAAADYCVRRLNADGSNDASFGNAGSANTSVLGTNDYIASSQALALQADGKLIAAGRCYNASTAELHLCVARFDNAGLDPSYGL